MKSYPFLWVCLALAVGPLDSLRGQPATVPSKEQIATELSEASARYIAALGDYQCEQSSETRGIGSETVAFRSSVRCRQLGENGLMLLTSSTDVPDPDRVVAVNSRYSFELRQPPGKVWVLTSYNEIGEGPREVFPYLGTNTPISRGLAPYWLEEGLWLPDLFAQDRKGTRIGPISSVAVGEQNVVRVGFEYPSNHTPETVCKGHVDLLPARAWVVSGWVSEVARNGVTRRTVLEREFHPGNDPVPLPNRERTSVTSSISAGAGRETTLTYRWTKERADPAEFRLTAFGLPEPPGIKWDRPVPMYLWVILAACGTAVLAIGFRYLARRKSASGLPGTQP